jgi:uncharacterized protein YbaR (Trm112 family)
MTDQPDSENLVQGILKNARCPITLGKLYRARPELIEQLTQRMQDGDLQYRNGESVTESLSGGLVSECQKYFYPEHNSIQVLLADNAIELSS